MTTTCPTCGETTERYAATDHVILTHATDPTDSVHAKIAISVQWCKTCRKAVSVDALSEG
jgi:endogenous inhibitor of DNA gyrase (YacG/DUF329 family)